MVWKLVTRAGLSSYPWTSWMRLLSRCSASTEIVTRTLSAFANGALHKQCVPNTPAMQGVRPEGERHCMLERRTEMHRLILRNAISLIHWTLRMLLSDTAS